MSLLPIPRTPLDLATSVAVGNLWARLSSPVIDGGDIYWLEFAPSLGRSQVLRLTGGAVELVTPPDVDVRSGVHEYGGGAYAVRDGLVVFSDGADGRLWSSGHESALTPAGGDVRYADVTITGEAIYAVRERHERAAVINDLVRIPPGGGEVEVAASGRDFYSFPRVSPDGRYLAWTAWDHPGMPFIGCELWVAETGHPRHAVRIAGGPDESIFQPQFDPAGRLHYVSDRSGWWSLYRAGDDEPVCAIEAELGWPQWFLGLSSYVFLEDGRVAALLNRDGRQRLFYLDSASGWRDAALPFAHVEWPYLSGDGKRVVFVAAEPAAPPSLVCVDTVSGAHEVLRSSLPPTSPLAPSAHPEPLRLFCAGEPIGGYLYRPPNDVPTPLVVLAHGGPTDQTVAGLRVEIELLVSRGIAVADVDYAGSTGYGRSYRDRLAGTWGLADVEDCVRVATALADAGIADRRRIAIMGGSAGGYITLCCMAFSDVFCAGVSLYGIADLALWDATTHKFEASYTEWLVGTRDAGVMRDRSPTFARTIRGPLLLLQGIDDRVVTLEHQTAMADAARAAGAQVEKLTLAGEGHGFRRPENVRAAYEAILDFLERAFG